MPRLQVISDLHREFAPYQPEEVGADLVILAGDIDHGTRGLEWARATWPRLPIVYVAGNHEYYGEAIPHLTAKLRAGAESLGIHFLENAVAEILGLRILGCTLWTDFNLFGSGSAAAMDAVVGMADYRAIRVSPDFHRLRPRDTVAWHRRSVEWLGATLPAATTPTVVVTHHAPSARSLAPSRAHDPANAGFASDLDRLIEATRPALWIHGHTHHNVDYRLHGTRIVSNQKGYEDEPDTGFRPQLVLDLPVPGR